MSVINIPPDEQSALNAIDPGDLDKLIRQAIQDGRTDCLSRLSLHSCGLFVASKVDHFVKALAEHRAAISSREREEAAYCLRRAGSDLSFAVNTMKLRMETEQKEAQLFQIGDRIIPPLSFCKRLTVTVGYQWRKTIEDNWTFGNITFVHEVDLSPDYSRPAPKRKPSRAKQAQELQSRLYQTWKYLMEGALCSVRDYFQGGGDGAKIPKTFDVKADLHTRGLNNHSTKFWLPDRPA